MNQDEICRRLNRAIQKLIEHDRDLLERDVNERSITHRLAMYLQEEFPRMCVDCEFNRDHNEVKKLISHGGTVRTDDTNAVTVFPDIIVHKRATNRANLLVIEAKKTKNSKQSRGISDREKLKAFKGDPQLRYEHAVFLQLQTGADAGGYCLEFIEN